MKIEVLVRCAKTKKGMFDQNETKEERRERLEDEKVRKLIGNDDDMEFEPESKFLAMFDPKNLDFYYQPYVLDTKSIEDFFPYDEKHTVLVTAFCGQLPVKITWDYWKKIWQSLTSETITTIEEK